MEKEGRRIFDSNESGLVTKGRERAEADEEERAVSMEWRRVIAEASEKRALLLLLCLAVPALSREDEGEADG